MKTMKLFSTIVIVLMMYANDLNAQRAYNTAIGIRAGGTSGLTVKQFTGSSTALEGILGIWPDGFGFTLLIEKYAGSGLDGLNWYYGGGGHIAAHNNRHFYNYPYERNGRRYGDGELGFGVDGIVGIEYKIPPIPIALSLDLKPFVEVTTHGNAFLYLDPGLGIKFTF